MSFETVIAVVVRIGVDVDICFLVRPVRCALCLLV